MVPGKLSHILFGQVEFTQSEEFDAFRYKFLIVLMLSAALATALFVVGEYTQVNRIQTPHMVSMQMFTVCTLVLWAVLRGRPHVFKPIAWVYEIICLMEYTSSLWLVPADELRLMWFFVNIPGVFILLGVRAGWFITGLSAVWLMVSNTLMPVPYSVNAMATALVSMAYLGFLFHAYGAESMSYFKRMRAYTLELEQLASHDPLTGALNARAYYAACTQYIGLAKRSNQPYAVLFIDLDHFKRVNDTYGHAAGDAVLRAVSNCLHLAVRKSDFLGRIGGEEFSVFLPNTSSMGAQQLAEAIRLSIEVLHPSIGEQKLPVTASVGVAVCEGVAMGIQEIQRQADQAMYEAKSLGRNRVSVFNGAPTLGLAG